jgi:hypothetical protein
MVKLISLLSDGWPPADAEGMGFPWKSLEHRSANVRNRPAHEFACQPSGCLGERKKALQADRRATPQRLRDHPRHMRQRLRHPRPPCPLSEVERPTSRYPRQRAGLCLGLLCLARIRQLSPTHNVRQLSSYLTSPNSYGLPFVLTSSLHSNADARFSYNPTFSDRSTHTILFTT